jgi:hypothetical protein
MVAIERGQFVGGREEQVCGAHGGCVTVGGALAAAGEGSCGPSRMPLSIPCAIYYSGEGSCGVIRVDIVWERNKVHLQRN